MPTNPPQRLYETDAAIAKGMLARGDKQHDIAAYFGVNGGRIAEIASGDRFAEVRAADPADLPPPGPYHVRCMLRVLERAVIRVGAEKVRLTLQELAGEGQ